MLRRFLAPAFIFGALALTGCGHSEANEYPASARTQFAATCPLEDAVCGCTWERLTRSISYEDYEAAMTRFREEGLMDPRVTHARTYCIEHS